MSLGSGRRVAVIGSGISGLGLAHRLTGQAELTLFEAAGRFGGHACTVSVSLPGPTGPVSHGVDVGFLVFNQRTYPKLARLLGELGIEPAASEMSFSVQAPASGLEWSGRNIDTLFSQRRNLLRPRFWRMLADIARFNRLATTLAERGAEAELIEPLRCFLDRHGFGTEFRTWYFMPMVGSIWSCAAHEVMRFPVGTLIRFCHNHGLLQWNGRPQWYTVPGGSRSYVQRMVERLEDARLNTPVRRVSRRSGIGVRIDTDDGHEWFDEVVFACHSDQALALLDDATPMERALLGSIRYRDNLALLHTDTRLLPRSRKAWAAWNHEHSPPRPNEDAGACVHYWLNCLQALPFEQQLVLTLNPRRQPQAGNVIDEFRFSHPVFDGAAIEAQRQLPRLQGRLHTWFCGAWTKYGFHEDGLRSGLEVADSLIERLRERACAAA